MTYTTNRSMFTVPLTSKVYKLAKSFQNQYENPVKARQVYLNTLAVYAVDTYCQCLGIATDLEASDSLNPIMQPLMDIADLEIEGIGKLECRPVLPEDEECYISADAWENRIGYVAVEIDESLREATLLGFYPPINALEMMERISFDSFQPLEALLDHLDRIESALDFFQSEDALAVKVREKLIDPPLPEIAAQLERIYRTYDRHKWQYAGGEFLASYLPIEESVAFRGDTQVKEAQQNNLQDLAKELLEKLDEIWGDNNLEETAPVTARKEQTNQLITTPRVASIPGMIKLSDWLQDIDSLLESGFQSLETFLNTLQGNQVFRFATAPRSRSAETEETFISVTGVKEIQLSEYRLTLVVGCQLESKQTTGIVLRLYPTGENTYLPSGVQLIVLDESEEVFLEAVARSADNWMQLEFRGEPGESFKVKVAFGNINVTHNFVI